MKESINESNELIEPTENIELICCNSKDKSEIREDDLKGKEYAINEKLYKFFNLKSNYYN